MTDVLSKECCFIIILFTIYYQAKMYTYTALKSNINPHQFQIERITFLQGGPSSVYENVNLYSFGYLLYLKMF